MEILRPHDMDDMTENCLKGKIRITTRCLWLDKGKLLDALYKAAHAALSSCPVNCPLSHMERTVSEVLRKVVRKYSGKRPEVIAVASENPVAVVSEEVNGRLSGKSHTGLNISALRKAFDGNRQTKKSRRIQDEDDNGHESLVSTSQLELEDDEINRLSGKTAAAASVSDKEASIVSESQDSDGYWKSSSGLSAVPNDKLETRDDISYLIEKLTNRRKGDKNNEEFDETINHSSKPSKSTKRNKWKPEEVKKVIKLRGELHDRFQVARGRMALWKEISSSLITDGFNRTPGQCKSLWASLVQKYEESKGDEKSKKSWPYFQEMDTILSSLGEMVKS